MRPYSYTHNCRIYEVYCICLEFRYSNSGFSNKGVRMRGCFAFAVAMVGMGVALSALAGPRDAQWKKVREAQSKGLPKTAIELLEPIIAAAKADKAYGEAVRAIGMKIAFEGTIQGNKPEEKITRIQSEIATAPEEMKPLLEALLANWYWHYFQQNRWRFTQRTQTAAQPGVDFTTWDLPRILAEIDTHFTKALVDEKRLKSIPVAAFNDLLEKGSTPDTYRPTLYDFIACNALAFYCAGEQGAAKAEDNFELSADGPIFASTDEFLKWKPDTTDTDSPTLKAVRLYQGLLAFHGDDKDASALLDADLARLKFGKNKAVGEEKEVRYKAALKRFAEVHARHELSAVARFEWAGVLNSAGEPREAHAIATAGMKAFPDSVGGRMCYNLVQQIEAKSASITTERVWNEPLPTIDVTYRNVTKVFFRAVPYDWSVFLDKKHSRPEQLNDKERKELLAKKPALEWSADLPPTADFKERTARLPAPTGLALGFYFLVASHDPSFRDKDNQVSYTNFFMSDLALIVRQREGSIEGFVLEANSGEPVKGASVTLWYQDNSGGRRPEPKLTTNGNGFFTFGANDSRGYLIQAKHKNDEVASMGDAWTSRRADSGRFSQTVFFTDRSLYRPGQMIHYKGICLKVDQKKSSYEVMAGQDVTAVFLDPNRKEIARQQVRTNDYGSFSGSFTAPRDRLAGRMSIRVDGGPQGETSFNVEEYKRPKFQVELPAPKEAAKLNAEVVVTGKATAYTGAAIGGAKVKWRITRMVRFPPWCWWSCWYFRPNVGQGQAIAHGMAVTENDGSFTVRFTAKPDMSVPEKDEPIFDFSVNADVTDTTGETRSAQRVVRAGYTALQATLVADEWQTPEKAVEISVKTSSLDNEAQTAEGTLKVYALTQPEKVIRPQLKDDIRMRWDFRGGAGLSKPSADPSDPNSWELGKVAAELPFTTDKDGTVKLSAALKTGVYRAMLETKDRFGKTVTARLPLTVIDPAAKQFGVKVPTYFVAAKWSLEPGESLNAVWGTGYDKGRAFVEIERDGKVSRASWTAADRTQEVIAQAIDENMRGGFTLRVTYVRENRAYFNERVVEVPWSNKQLSVKWEHFTSKLAPGQKETWTAVVSGPGARTVVAEMVAGLYDASLDAYLPHQWMQQFGVFRHESSWAQAQFENSIQHLQHIMGGWGVDSKDTTLTYRSFPAELAANIWGYGFGGGRDGLRMMPMKNKAVASATLAEAAVPCAPAMAKSEGKSMDAADKDAGTGGQAQEPPPQDLGKVAARKNLNETAFFFPHLLSDQDGVVKMEFTMPEALTEWKFMGFAHDRALRSGFLDGKTVTAKDLMVEPNPPRFVREGDVVEFTVKVSNQSAGPQSGNVRLTLADARTLKSVDEQLGNTKPEQPFEIPSKESRSFSWRLTIPDGMDFLTYKAVGATDKLSDGEEGYLPVLSRRVLVTESLPLPIRGKQTKQFDFKRLRESGDSKTLRNETLTVQMTSQPAWYAVMALPYLMEYQHECAEQTFNRLYANSLARHIAKSDPKIRRVFDLWRDTPALDSPLEKNQDLKAVMIEETPWLRQAVAESQARRNVGILFDDNRLDDETARCLRKLVEQQRGDGSWSWFPGGPGDDYITLYITTGFGRLRHLGVAVDTGCAVKALTRLDAWIAEVYRKIDKKDVNHLSPTIAMYLYGRSFFLKDKAIDGAAEEAVDYFLEQAKKFWLDLNNRQSQAHLAVACKRFGENETPMAIMKSIKERSVSTEELGMFWRELELSWWWFRAPIETQAMMVEAFDEVMNDAQAVDDCKVWLLKQKQTQDWKTTKATADAVYALLLRGTGLLASDALVEVSLGDTPITPEKVEAGTGFYEQRFVRGEIKPEMGRITVKKTNDGVSWGAAHWQYLEDMTKVTPFEGTPLKLKKTLFIKDATKKGQVLKPVDGPLAVGDELVVRVELRVDRDMEYVHLKDQRGSGTEPVNVLSQYKFQDGLGYYESTKDTASHFFINYLPKGVYVFEYSTRVQLRGKYQTGIASVQCMYAPEFNSHSESFELEVR